MVCFYRVAAIFTLNCYFGRKSQLLAGSNVYIAEDFSKKVKDRRTELQKFMRKMKKQWRVTTGS